MRPFAAKSIGHKMMGDVHVSATKRDEAQRNFAMRW